MIARFLRWREQRRYAREVQRVFDWSVVALDLIAETNPGLARTTLERARAVVRDPATGRIDLRPEALIAFIEVHEDALRYEHARR